MMEEKSGPTKATTDGGVGGDVMKSAVDAAEEEAAIAASANKTSSHAHPATTTETNNDSDMKKQTRRRVSFSEQAQEEKSEEDYNYYYDSDSNNNINNSEVSIGKNNTTQKKQEGQGQNGGNGSSNKEPRRRSLSSALRSIRLSQATRRNSNQSTYSDYSGGGESTTARQRRRFSSSRRSSNGSNLSEADDSGGNTYPSGNTQNTSTSAQQTEEEKQRKKMDKGVLCLRISVIITLVIATAVVATVTYLYVSDNEEDDFKSEYDAAVVKVNEGFQTGIDSTVYTAEAFSSMYTSRYGDPVNGTSTWPNATMPDFQEQARGLLKLNNGRAMSFNPIINNKTNRIPWEAHATESAYIFDEPCLVETDEAIRKELGCFSERVIADGIFRTVLSEDGTHRVRVDDPGYEPDSKYPYVLVPVWQIAPIVSNVPAVMFNLHSVPNRRRALDDMLTYNIPVLTDLLQLVQDKEVRPASILFHPVVASYQTADGPNNVEGSVSVVFNWDTVLSRVLPKNQKGIVCVLKTNTDLQYEFTFLVEGDNVTLMGEGDLHDRSYDHMKREYNATVGRTDEALAAADFLINYQLIIYPSEQFEDQYVSNNPIIFTVVAVMIFVFTAGLFLGYDYLVEHRQSSLAKSAERTGRIVNSMFPAAFRDRLFEHSESGATNHDMMNTSKVIAAPSTSKSGGDNETGGAKVSRRDSDDIETGGVDGDNVKPDKNKQKRRGSALSTSLNKGVKTMKKFVKGDSKYGKPDYNVGAAMAAPSGSAGFEKPIADFFPETSIMFCDLVGFTAWSSAHDPHEVFQLLEVLFWEFDQLAAKYGVFKLGTIGDCYIGVTGLPEPMEDHASVLADFTIECKKKVTEIRRNLLHTSPHLGVEKLNMRFGINSGPITAGILRGQKSRFELFGDTINTASRMESTSVTNGIQVSEETATLLRNEGMGSWLAPRKGLVEAKGKGKLQTYWLINPSVVDPTNENIRDGVPTELIAMNGMQESPTFQIVVDGYNNDDVNNAVNNDVNGDDGGGGVDTKNDNGENVVGSGDGIDNSDSGNVVVENIFDNDECNA